jgi:proteasome assembly chaperone (PAC2) family protein
MGIKLYREPELQKPMMFVGWPGIGSIGIMAVNVLKDILKAEEFGEIES